MDLNLYLGLARSVQPRSSDLGSDLALGSIPASAPSSEEMSSPPDPSDREYSPSFPYYNPSDPPILVEEFEEPHFSVSFPRMRRTLRVPDELDELYSPSRSPPILPSWAAESSRRERSPLDLPGLRFRSMIDSSRRLQPLRFRSSLPLPLGPEQLTSGNLESNAKPEASEEEEKEEKNKNAANFECNICFDLAKEPVLTSCGHLFCWPCLFRCLHVQSERKECCVCKVEVIESNITPIYGRGCSEGTEVFENGDDPGLRIPPRPRGNRIESFRQKHRPISRRFGEGIASSWRRFLSQQLRNRSSGLFGDGSHHAALTRLRARRMAREGMNSETGSVAGEPEMPRENTLAETGDEIDLWDRFFRHGLGVASSDRLAALAADVGRAVRSGSRNRTSASYVSPPSPELAIPRSNVVSTSAADQASASSTIAVIQGDVGSAEGPVELNSAGSSGSYRRRGRSSSSGSLDVDDGVLRACKRRRLN